MSQLKWSLLILFLAAGLTAADREGLEHYCRNIEGVALHGYSPVSYFQKNKAELGAKEFALTHNGVVYWFVDAAQATLFKENPERYEPAHGGWCSVMMGSSGDRAEANPEAFKIVNDRLLVFYRGKLQNGARVDGLQIWNDRDKEQALLRKADRQWREILAGSRKSRIVDVGDSAVPEQLRKKTASLGDFPAWSPGDARIDGSRLKAFAATYQSQWGMMTLRLDPSHDLDNSRTFNVIVELHYPNAVMVENYVLKQQTLETRYCFRPVIAGPDSHYLAAFFANNGVRGSRSYFLRNEVEEIKADFASPMLEAQLCGYVLAGAKLETGLKGKLPCYDPSSLKPYWRSFEVKPVEKLTLQNKKTFNARPVLFDEGTASQTTVWLIDHPPYVVRRERLVSGSPVIQDLLELHRP